MVVENYSKYDAIYFSKNRLIIFCFLQKHILICKDYVDLNVNKWLIITLNTIKWKNGYSKLTRLLCLVMLCKQVIKNYFKYN